MPSHQHSPNYGNYCFFLLWCIYTYDFNCHTKILILRSFLSLKKNPIVSMHKNRRERKMELLCHPKMPPVINTKKIISRFRCRYTSCSFFFFFGTRWWSESTSPWSFISNPLQTSFRRPCEFMAEYKEKPSRWHQYIIKSWTLARPKL